MNVCFSRKASWALMVSALVASQLPAQSINNRVRIRLSGKQGSVQQTKGGTSFGFLTNGPWVLRWMRDQSFSEEDLRAYAEEKGIPLAKVKELNLINKASGRISIYPLKQGPGGPNDLTVGSSAIATLETRKEGTLVKDFRECELKANPKDNTIRGWEVEFTPNLVEDDGSTYIIQLQDSLGKAETFEVVKPESHWYTTRASRKLELIPRSSAMKALFKTAPTGGRDLECSEDPFSGIPTWTLNSDVWTHLKGR